MNTVNFTEIPKANTGIGDQDTFEMFARDLLHACGYQIIQEPGRGADAGRDLILKEVRIGVGGETAVRWVVSCKHFAHSGKSVGVEDEINISDRLRAAKATGFLCFYSTIPSSGLVTRLQELSPECHLIYDRAKIEASLLRDRAGIQLFERYFPLSYGNWHVANPPKPQLLFNDEQLKCAYCNKDLLAGDSVYWSMFVTWQDIKTKLVDTVYWCCKGRCDDILRAKHDSPDRLALWDEMCNYTNPTQYILEVTYRMESFNDGTRFTRDALALLRKFLITMFHQVARNLTPKEQEDLKMQIAVGIL